ncbi:MAG: FAD-binding domain-containing protein [Pseudomonadales bacterium]
MATDADALHRWKQAKTGFPIVDAGMRELASTGYMHNRVRDKDCVYIKQWLPELEPFPAQVIHRLEKEGDFYWPKIVDLRKSGDLIKEQFKSVRMRS